MLTMTQRMDDSVNALAADFDLTAMENTQFENFPEVSLLSFVLKRSVIIFFPTA